MIFRCYIDSNLHITEDVLHDIVEKQRLFNQFKISEVDAGWQTTEWLVHADLGQCSINNFNWGYIGDCIYNDLPIPSKMSIYMDNIQVYSKIHQNFNTMNKIDLSVAQVKPRPYDFSGEREIEKKSCEW